MRKSFIIPQQTKVDGEIVEVPVKIVKKFRDDEKRFFELRNTWQSLFPMCQVLLGKEGDFEGAHYAAALLDYHRDGRGYWKLKYVKPERELPMVDGRVDVLTVNKKGGEDKFPLKPVEKWSRRHTSMQPFHSELTVQFGPELADEIVYLLLTEFVAANEYVKEKEKKEKEKKEKTGGNTPL